MTTACSDIATFLNEELAAGTYRDACPNGMQVHGREMVRRVATCTSVSEACFRQARDAGADLLIVHHGLFWEGASRVVDPLMARRLRILLEAEMNLMAYHLPLDASHRLGNNAELARVMGLEKLDFGFGHYKGTAIGCKGSLPGSSDLQELAQTLSTALDSQPFLINAGRPVRNVGVLSGGGGDIPYFLEARAAGCDTFVTGVVFEQSYAVARELELNVVAPGHYNSEKLGVRAVGEALVEKFGVELVHLDVPNPL